MIWPTKMDKRALLKLADHIEAVPDSGFKMDVWCSVVDGKTASMEHHKRQYSCGMAACVGGHAAIKFPKRLRLRKMKDWYGKLVLGRLFLGKTSRIEGPSAFSRAFGICDVCAEHLTDSDAPHDTPKKAAKAIRGLVSGKGFDKAYNGKRIPDLNHCNSKTTNCND